MKKIIIHFIILISTLTNYNCEDQFIFPSGGNNQSFTSSEKKIVSSSEIFGFKLFKEVNRNDVNKNIFISPLCVSMALGMTLNGAAGATYDSIRSVLELNGLTEQEINESYKGLIEKLIELDPKVIFNISNSIWYRNTMIFQQEFINKNQIYFDAEVSSLNFEDPSSVSIINNWVNQNTGGKIDEILERIPPEAVMYLLNAVFFKADWKYLFDQSLTIDDFFITAEGESVPCKMMQQKNNFSYYSNELFQAVDLPYGDSLFSMMIFLPNPDRNTNDILNQFNKDNWDKWKNSFDEEEGKIWMPKFEVGYELKLNDVLAAMGMGTAFQPSADFTRMYSPGGLWISEVKHKTYIKVDEKGTEAAAVTLVEYIKAINSGFQMKINRPFIYVIHEKNSRTILFIGKIVNPELK
jgi:serine protease inhibitor